MDRYRNRWALVTGASSGLGLAYARALAGEGANLILTARRAQRLTELAGQLSGTFGTRVETIPADLSTSSGAASVMNELSTINLLPDILVSNAGYGEPGEFVEVDLETHERFLRLMVTAHVQLCHGVLPAMRQRGYGRVALIASLAGLLPSAAGHTLYGASKAFLINFAEALRAEGAEHGINVTAVCPGLTHTEFHDVNGARDRVSKLPSYMFMDAKTVATESLNAMERGKTIHVPGRFNKLSAGLSRLLPRSWVAHQFNRQARALRQKSPPQ
ncbi:MAG: SDR family oxidoreductase [Pseudomonadota bacterium]